MGLLNHKTSSMDIYGYLKVYHIWWFWTTTKSYEPITNSTSSTFIQANTPKKRGQFLSCGLSENSWYLLLMFQLRTIWKESVEGMTGRRFPKASLHVSPFNPQNDSEIPLETSFLGPPRHLGYTFKTNSLTDINPTVSLEGKETVGNWSI